ncbi:Geranylgeranylglyceryl diphosphate synthase [Flavobacterium psychrophilum]|nr:Geranylgeranylglyceryl diphosphate synthase [Flavobacterium psychrophilum]
MLGGGIRDLSDIKKAHNTGADLVVIGTAFENNSNFFNQNL